MSSSFGQWYDDQRAAEGGAGGSNSSWFSVEQALPLFNTDGLQAYTDGLQSFSFESMKQNMEAQMPKKILGMGYQQRFKAFCALLFLSALFFALAFFVGLPMMAIKPQKFALSFTCGSITFMGSFGILKGPMEHLQSMFTADRMFFTTIYFGSILMTLYLTFTKGGIQGYALVMAASATQLLALLWYLVSFLPGGAMGLQLVARAMITMLQPIIGACCRLQAMCISKCVSYCVRG